MTDAWRGEITIDDLAARMLAFDFGFGSGWARDYRAGIASAWKAVQEGEGGYEGDERTPAAVAGLHIGHATETLELAKHALQRDRKKWPRWLTRLPAAERDALLAWSADHPFRRVGPDRVREFPHWKTTPTTVLLPRAPDGRVSALALGTLPRPLRAVLELVALERGEHVDTVLAMLRGAGVASDVAPDALMRWLYPRHRETQAATAKRMRMRKEDCAAWLREREPDVDGAVRILKRWQHSASVRFIHARGGRIAWVRMPVGDSEKPMRRLSLPRFRNGWDTKQRSGPWVQIEFGNQNPRNFGVIGREGANRHLHPATRRRAA